MKLLRTPTYFIENSIQLEGSQQEYNDYVTNHSVLGLTNLAEQKLGDQMKSVFMKVAGERITFYIKLEKIKMEAIANEF